MQFLCHKENGKLAIETPDKYKHYLSGLSEGEKLTIDIEKRKSRRSISQNSYYWLYLGVIETETGNTQDDLHAYFKRKFLKPKEAVLFGENVKISGSTTGLSKGDFGDYLDKICALTEVPLPDPELVGYTPKDPGYLTEKSQIAYPDEKEFKEPTI